MDDLYNGTMLRRWSLDLVTGRQECAEDAVDTGLISAEDRATIETKNAVIHAAIDDVETYEAALRVVVPEEPHTQPVYDGDGNEIGTEPTPAYEAWTAAQVTIGETPDTIKALARLRAGEASEDDSALVAATWGAPVDITVPTPEEISRKKMPPLTPRQIRLVMLMLGLTDAAVDAKIDAIPDASERAAAHIEWQWATTIKRTHALVESLRVAMDFPADQFDALWLYGAAL